MTLLTKLLGRSRAEAVTWLDPGDLMTLLTNPVPPLVVDVREPDEFVGPLGHIDEARNIPLNQIPGRLTELRAEKRPLVFVCHTDRRSAAAAEHFRRSGASEVGVLSGGMVAWRSRPTS